MSEPFKKRCRFLNTAQGCRHGSRCRFSHATSPAERPSRRARRNRASKAKAASSDSQACDNGVLNIPGYVYDPATKKYFKHDPLLQPQTTQPRTPSRPALINHPAPLLTAIRSQRTYTLQQRRASHSLRLQSSLYLQDVKVDTYSSCVSRLQPFPNGDVGILAGTIYRQTASNDKGVYTAALQFMMPLEARTTAAVDDVLVWPEDNVLRVAHLHGAWRSITHPYKGHCHALQACGSSTILAGIDKRYLCFDLHSETVTATHRYKSDVLATTSLPALNSTLVGLRNGQVHLQDDRANSGLKLPFHGDGASVNYLSSVPHGHETWYISHSLETQGLRLYDVRACKLSNEPVQRFGAHSNYSQIQPRVAVAPDSCRLAAVDDKNTLRLWDLTTGCVLATKNVNRCSPVMFRSTEGEMLYVAEDGCTLRMLTGKPQHG
eukprot:m.214253 g.214253  ORF g.214253 m.214253 type:complete len:434 (+) comp17190_c0_seq2:103-1404(+)